MGGRDVWSWPQRDAPRRRRRSITENRRAARRTPILGAIIPGSILPIASRVCGLAAPFSDRKLLFHPIQRGRQRCLHQEQNKRESTMSRTVGRTVLALFLLAVSLASIATRVSGQAGGATGQ